ncbi:MAG: hypothetical protein VW557_12030 [Rhodospirillaceae bacterium]
MPVKNKTLGKINSFIRKVGLDRREVTLKLIELQRDVEDLQNITNKIRKEIISSQKEITNNGYLIQKKKKYTFLLQEQIDIACNRIEFLEKEIEFSKNQLRLQTKKEDLLQDKLKKLSLAEN